MTGTLGSFVGSLSEGFDFGRVPYSGVTSLMFIPSGVPLGWDIPGLLCTSTFHYRASPFSIDFIRVLVA